MNVPGFTANIPADSPELYGYYLSFDDHEAVKLCYPFKISGSFVELLIRGDLSYNWTSYTAQDPVPTHAVKVGTSPENKALFYVPLFS